MKNPRIRTLSTLCVALLMSGPALADVYSKPGVYAFLGGLTALESFPEVAGASYGNSYGFDARVGLRLNDYLAFEVEGNFLSGFDVDVPTQGGTAKFNLEGGNVTANAKVVLPLGRFQPYALVGIGGMWADLRTRDITGVTCTPGFFGWWCAGTTTRIDNGGSFVAKFGGGSDFWLTEDFALTLDAVYMMPTGELEDLNSIKLGWGVKFKY